MGEQHTQSDEESDRERWDQRYRLGAYAQRHWSSAYLQQLLNDRRFPTSGRALDLACGRGRNSLFLAKNGYQVDAIDVSSVAIARAATASLNQNLRINWQCRDLLSSQQPLSVNIYALAVMFRFVAPSLLVDALGSLQPGGVLVVEEHLQWSGSEILSGPGSNRFRVAPGELLRQLEASGINFEVVDQFEGLISETADDGAQTQAAVARVCIRRGST